MELSSEIVANYFILSMNKYSSFGGFYLEQDYHWHNDEKGGCYCFG